MPHYQKVQTVKELWASFIFPFLSAVCYVKKLTYPECCWLKFFVCVTMPAMIDHPVLPQCYDKGMNSE